MKACETCNCLCVWRKNSNESRCEHFQWRKSVSSCREFACQIPRFSSNKVLSFTSLYVGNMACANFYEPKLSNFMNCDVYAQRIYMYGGLWRDLYVIISNKLFIMSIKILRVLTLNGHPSYFFLETRRTYAWKLSVMFDWFIFGSCSINRISFIFRHKSHLCILVVFNRVQSDVLFQCINSAF